MEGEHVAVSVVMPRLSDSMEEGTIVTWLVAEGDQVQQGHPLAEIETDNATVTFEADVGGVILALSVSDGAAVPVGAPIAVIGEAGELLPDISIGRVATSVASAQRLTTSAPSAQRFATSASSAPRFATRTKASPLARRIAAQRGVDLAALAGTGPSGRVVRADVERASSAAHGAGSATEAPPAVAMLPEPTVATKGESSVRELTRLQRTVARRMAQSRSTVPDIELRVEVNMGAAVALRELLREVADPAPSFNDLIVKAVALALREFPAVNGAYRDASIIETYSRVNVGIAVAADDALVVPTIFDADEKSLGQISEAARTLAARVRHGSIAPSELAGGTFTVSNLGMYGVDSFSAVINPPQAAILAVGALKRRPIVDESGELVARPTIVLTLACDHRILYGVDGARFLSHVRELLERPYALLM
jgi:pyruvate dehydrogenase E2 component (dihydrolipoyllysine-residue acetyltransferase)